MQNNISDLRDDVLKLNKQLFQLMQSRKKVIASIQITKKSSSVSGFDAKREWEVFQLLSDELNAQDMNELFLFSFLMETQVGGDYPKWSQCAHLRNSTDELFEKVNPLLLKLVKNEYYKRLKLIDSYEYLETIGD